MPLAQYGTTNPRGLEPWAIEQAIAPAAYGGSQAEAQGMLQTYQNQREAAGNVYGEDLAQQHDFARQQLAQQLYEANLKGLAELKDPTVLQIAANAPQYQQLFGGAGQDAISDALGRSVMQQQAGTFEKSGQGYNQFAQGGAQVDLNAVPGMQGVNASVTGPALVRAALIRAQSAAAQGNKPEKTTVTTQIAGNAEGTTHTVSSRVPTSEVNKTIQSHNQIDEAVRQDRSGQGATSLAPAPGSGTQQTQTSGGGGPTKLDTNSKLGAAAQQAAMKKADEYARNPATKAIADSMKATMNGATFQTFMTPSGQVVVKGSQGWHPIGQAQK